MLVFVVFVKSVDFVGVDKFVELIGFVDRSYQRIWTYIYIYNRARSRRKE